MTKTDFFRIVIKLLGLYSLIITLFNILSTDVYYVFLEFDFFLFFWVFGVVAFILFLYFLIIRNTDVIIKLLKLNKGFDDDHILQFHHTVFRMG